MNIFVIATALQAGGGITIYKQFLSHLPEYIGKDKYWIFVNPVLPQVVIEGVTYISFPLQSKIKRILLEGRLLKIEAIKLGVQPDVVVSLQNNGCKCFDDCKQVVYFHQSLPLYPGYYNPFKSNERTLFIYKYIFPCVVKCTWVKNTQFVVQTPVVKKRFVSYFGVPAENVHVCFPDIEKIDVLRYKGDEWGDSCFHFLYVGGGYKYQNGDVLVKAMKKLKSIDSNIVSRIKIHLTISKEHAHTITAELLESGVEDNFIFEGTVCHEKLLNYYKSVTALLAPSTIETVGLPILETATLGTAILVANQDYAHEVLAGYDGVSYIDIHNIDVWAKEIKKNCQIQRKFEPLVQNRKTEWGVLFDIIKE